MFGCLPVVILKMRNYEKAIASCNHPKTINMFKNIILYVNNGSSGELYVENKDTGEYENRFYP